MKEKIAVHTTMLLVLLTVSAYFLADTVDVVIGSSLGTVSTAFAAMEQQRSAPGLRREMSDYASILDRGLFGDGRSRTEGPAQSVPVLYKLIGTVEGDAFAGAVLEDAAGQAFYRIDQRMPDGSSIIKVSRDKVVLRLSDGSTITVEVVDDTKIVKSGNGGSIKRLSDGKFLVDQREVLASTENMGLFLTQARAIPYLVHGKTAGFKINDIVPGSLYAKIGLRNGDVIQQVNAQPLDDPGKFFQLYQGLRTEKNIYIDLLRNGRHQTMNYEIR